MGAFGSTRKSTRTNNNYEQDSSVDDISQQGYNTNATNIGDTDTSISAGKQSTINNVSTDHGSVDASMRLATKALEDNSTLTHQMIEGNHANNVLAFNSIDNVSKGAQEVAETAIFANVDAIDYASQAIESSNNNMLDMSIQAFDIMDGAHDRQLGATERLAETFADNTADVFDGAMLFAENVNSDSLSLARDLSGDLMNGLQDSYGNAFGGTRDAYQDSLESVSNHSLILNDSIMALSQDTQDAVSRAHEVAGERFTEAMEMQNMQSFGMIADLVAESSANSAAQFSTALDQITSVNEDAYKMVQDSAKTEGERTTDTLIKFAMGAVALVGVAFAFTRGGK